jgi:hypothetical protein
VFPLAQRLARNSDMVPDAVEAYRPVQGVTTTTQPMTPASFACCSPAHEKVKEMFTTQPESQPFDIRQEQLFAVVHEMIGGGRGREDDDHPLPPGPWDPVVRSALDRTSVLYGPGPEPWRAVLATILARHPEALEAAGGGYSFGDAVALNPQPLPPRYAFLVAVTQSVVSRAELLHEIATAMSREADTQGVVGGYTTRFSDDWCGTGFQLRYPRPGPRPHWFTRELSGLDLVLVAAQFDQAAKETFSREVQRSLADASARFLQAGLAKLRYVDSPV